MSDPTTPLAKSVCRAVTSTASIPGNPSSPHRRGQQARRIVHACQRAIRLFLNAPKDAEVIFTGDGIEADWLGILGWARGQASAPSIVFLEKQAHAAHLETISATIEHETCGRVVQKTTQNATPEADLTVVAPLWHFQHTTPCHIYSSTQAPAGCWGKHTASVSFDATTIGGPPGMGALVVSHQRTIMPLWHGGGQQNGMRPGTLPVALCAGFLTALQAYRPKEHTP